MNPLANQLLTAYNVIKGIHDRMTGRDQCGVRVYETGADHSTNWFVKTEAGHQIYTNGGRVGLCGTIKDGKRIYLCQEHYQIRNLRFQNLTIHDSANSPAESVKLVKKN